MKKDNKKDKFACFQWIRDVRAELSREMENMTPEETAEYIHAKYLESRKGRPKYSLAESNRMFDEYLAGQTKTRKAPVRRKAATRLAKT